MTDNPSTGGDEISALADLIKALERQKRLDQYINNCDIASDSQFRVEWQLGASVVGYEEVSREMGKIIRKDLPRILDQIRSATDQDVDHAREWLASIQVRLAR